MKRIVTLTAFAASIVLSPAAFAHGKAASGGSASGWAQTGWGGFAATNQSVYTRTSSSRFGVQTSTRASSTSIAAGDGPVAVGGSASAGSGGSAGY